MSNKSYWTKEEDEALKVAVSEHSDDARAAGQAFLTLGGRPRTYRALAQRIYVLTGTQAGVGKLFLALDKTEALPGATLRKGSKLARRMASVEARAMRKSTVPVVPPSITPRIAPPLPAGNEEKMVRWAVEGYTLGIISSEELVKFLGRIRGR